jgi:hypothetical protein
VKRVWEEQDEAPDNSEPVFEVAQRDLDVGLRLLLGVPKSIAVPAVPEDTDSDKLDGEDPDDKKPHEEDSSNLDDPSHWKVQKYGDVDGGIFTVDDEEDRNGSELLGLVVDGDAGIEGIEEEESTEEHVVSHTKSGQGIDSISLPQVNVIECLEPSGNAGVLEGESHGDDGEEDIRQKSDESLTVDHSASSDNEGNEDGESAQRDCGEDAHKTSKPGIESSEALAHDTNTLNLIDWGSSDGEEQCESKAKGRTLSIRASSNGSKKIGKASSASKKSAASKSPKKDKKSTRRKVTLMGDGRAHIGGHSDEDVDELELQDTTLKKYKKVTLGSPIPQEEVKRKSARKSTNYNLAGNWGSPFDMPAASSGRGGKTGKKGATKISRKKADTTPDDSGKKSDKPFIVNTLYSVYSKTS